MLYQIKSDGQCVTLKPGQLTSTNGCTRLPVQADTQPSKSPPQTNSACSETEKHLRSSLSQPHLCWSHSSIRNAIFPSAGPRLSLGVATFPVLGYLWAVCCCVWHYSSFKYRILHSDSDFLVPHSKTASKQSKARPLVNSLLRDKTRLQLHKVRHIQTVQNLQIQACVFFLQDTLTFECCHTIQQLWNPLSSTQRMEQHTFHLTNGAVHEPCIETVFRVTDHKLQLVLKVNILYQSIKKNISVVKTAVVDTNTAPSSSEEDISQVLNSMS